MAKQREAVARRVFATDDGDLTLHILPGADDSPSFEYQFVDQDGEVTASLETYGQDSVQALLFCIAAAGDYLLRFVPSASYADLGISALLTTDLSTTGAWTVQVSMPVVAPA